MAEFNDGEETVVDVPVEEGGAGYNDLGESPRAEDQIMHRVNLVRPPRLHALSIEWLLRTPKGEPVRGRGLEENEWKEAYEGIIGGMPARVSPIDALRCIVDVTEDVDILEAARLLNAIDFIYGQTVYSGTILQSRHAMVRRLDATSDRIRRLSLLESTESLSRERERQKEEMDDYIRKIRSELETLRHDLEQVSEGTGSNVSLNHSRTRSRSRSSERPLNFKPEIGLFSGTTPVPRGEVGFTQWKFQIEAALSNYSEHAVRTIMTSRITGPASGSLRYIGMNANIETILEEFQKRYLQKKTTDQLRHDFFSIKQQPKESIQSLSANLESAFTLLEEADPTVSRSLLKDRFFQSLTQRMRDSLRFVRNDPECTYDRLMEEARKIETERCDIKAVGISQSATMKVVHFEDECEDIEKLEKLDKKLKSGQDTLMRKLDGMTAQMKAMNAHSPVKGEKKRDGVHLPKSPNRDNNSKSRVFPKPPTTAAGPFQPNERPLQCYKCGGWNHMAKVCPTQGKVNWGELNRAGPASKKGNEEAPVSK